jgi:hypothetical protein
MKINENGIGVASEDDNFSSRGNILKFENDDRWTTEPRAC